MLNGLLICLCTWFLLWHNPWMIIKPTAHCDFVILAVVSQNTSWLPTFPITFCKGMFIFDTTFTELYFIAMLLRKSQHWFRWRLVLNRQQVITWTNGNPLQWHILVNKPQCFKSGISTWTLIMVCHCRNIFWHPTYEQVLLLLHEE